MTVQDLIHEVSAMPPHLPVFVLLSHCYDVDSEGGEGLRKIDLDESDCIEADIVKLGGGKILIWSK